MVKMLAFGLLGLVAAVAAAVGIARHTLPASACTVTEPQIDSLTMNMTYDKAKSLLGCDGVLLSKESYGDTLVIEAYAWRGDAWPYGRFRAEFFNKTLQATSKLWLHLAIGKSKH
jgi:hypothetical protein